MRFTVFCLILTAPISVALAEDPQPVLRPISEAQSVLAVYRENFGLASDNNSDGKPAIIFVAWPDGHVVWSGDRLKGGAPYRAGHIDAEKITSLLAHFEKDGLFDDEKLNQEHFGPDAQFTTILIKLGKKQVQMQSWHELYEASGKLGSR